MLSRILCLRPPVVRRRRWRVALLSLLLILALFPTLFSPIKTVKGLVVDTGIVLPFGASIDTQAGRVAFVNTTQFTIGAVFVYDIPSASSTVFAKPTIITSRPVIFGDRVLIAGRETSSSSDIFFCVLPHDLLLKPCGPWQLITKRPVPIGTTWIDAFGGLAFNGDLAVWPIFGGFDYYSFSSGTLTTVTVPSSFGQPFSLKTNGAVIAFQAFFSGSSTPLVMYYDPATGSLVNTGLPTSVSLSFSQNVIAFEEPVTPSRIRYYDILRNQSSPQGSGPVGTMPVVWGSRIAFSQPCDSESCIGYWNIHRRSFESEFLASTAAPVGFPLAIGERVIYFSSAGVLRFITVPMQGDVNLDGQVNILDLVIVGGCMFQSIKGTVC